MISAPRRGSSRRPWLNGVLAVTLSGCAAADTRGHVAVSEPDAADAAMDASAVTDSGMDGSPNDASADATVPNPHGPTPIYPSVEQALQLPYRGELVQAQLILAAKPSKLDVHINIDSTGSFGEEIAALQSELTRTVVPRLLERVADTQFGLSRFADFPRLPFGRPASLGKPDVPYQLLCPITAKVAPVTSALSALKRSLGHGADIPEASAEALYQVATGQGFTLDKTQFIAPFDAKAAAADGGGTAGGVGFRDGSLRVVLHITDAPAHDPASYAAAGIPGTHSLAQAASALNALGAHVIGINSTPSADPNYPEVRGELSELALTTGAYTAPVKARCATGISGKSVPTFEDQCPWVFDVLPNGSGLASSLVDAVVALLEDVHFTEVHAETGADPLGFIAGIELVDVPQSAGVAAPQTADRYPRGAPDGVPDSYVNVTARQKLGFAVLLGNPRIAPIDIEQRFRVAVRLLGDGVQLEERLLGVRVDAVTSPDLDRDAGPN
ncbi:MAG: hypothetical protein RL701_2669 [Pseudomonadota bacterium]